MNLLSLSSLLFHIQAKNFNITEHNFGYTFITIGTATFNFLHFTRSNLIYDWPYLFHTSNLKIPHWRQLKSYEKKAYNSKLFFSENKYEFFDYRQPHINFNYISETKLIESTPLIQQRVLNKILQLTTLLNLVELKCSSYFINTIFNSVLKCTLT